MCRENDLVWLAGFIDGDGGIYITVATRRLSTGQYFDDLTQTTYRASNGWVTISQKCVGTLERILQMVASYDLPLPDVVKPTYACSCTALWFSSQKGVQLLERISPYFRHPRHIIKAPLYLEFYKARGEERERVYDRWLEAKDHGYEDAPVPGWPEEEDLPYLAGFFEAEGCISINTIRTKYFNTASRVDISQKSVSMKQRVVEIVGRQDLPVPRLSSDHMYFYFSTHKGKVFLEKLLPFMHHPEKIAMAKFYIKFHNVPKSERQRLYFKEWLSLKTSKRFE